MYRFLSSLPSAVFVDLALAVLAPAPPRGRSKTTRSRLSWHPIPLRNSTRGCAPEALHPAWTSRYAGQSRGTPVASGFFSIAVGCRVRCVIRCDKRKMGGNILRVFPTSTGW